MTSVILFQQILLLNIYTAGLLGEQYIGLEAGGDDVDLKNGDKIAKTQDAIVLEKMISQFLFSKASETEDKNSKNEKDAVSVTWPKREVN